MDMEVLGIYLFFNLEEGTERSRPEAKVAGKVDDLLITQLFKKVSVRSEQVFILRNYSSIPFPQ